MFADGVRLGHHVDIVEAEIRQAQPREELKGLLELEIRRRLIERAAVPGAAEGAGAENIEPVPAEGMPVAHRHAQLLFHGFAEHHTILVVVTIGERVCGLRAFVDYWRDVAEI